MISYLKATSLSLIPGIKHGFLTRQHGLSKADEAQKTERLATIGQAFGSIKTTVAALRQIHSARVLLIDQPFRGELPQGDALVTQQPGLLLTVCTADCVPVLLAARDGQTIAAVHAGYRGAFLGIIENTVATMRKLTREPIVAALGPCIWPESYEVGQDFYDNYAPPPSLCRPGIRPGHWQFDLPGLVVSRLQKAGVSEIEASPADTYTNGQQFFSYRRLCHHPEKEQEGSNLSIVAITP